MVGQQTLLAQLDAESRRSMMQSTDQHMLAYAKYTFDKDKIKLSGIYFGGLFNSKTEAEINAKNCVNATKNGTVFPIIRPLELEHNSHRDAFLNAIYSIVEKVESQNNTMQETQEILSRTYNRAYKKR